MGTIVYGSGSRRITMDDRVLAHVKSVIVMKLRRNESFTVSWSREEAEGGGRTSIWVHPSIGLQFEFDESERPELNRDWLERLMREANASGDLRIVPEIEPA